MKRLFVLLFCFFLLSFTRVFPALTFLWEQNTQSIYKMSISPLGDKIVTVGEKGVYIHDLETGSLLKAFDGYQWGAFSSNDSLLFVIGEGPQQQSYIDVFDYETRLKVRTINLPDAPPLGGGALALSNDNKTIVACNRNGIYFLDFETGVIIKHFNTWEPDKQEVLMFPPFLFTKDDKYLIVNGAADSLIRFVNTLTYKVDYYLFGWYPLTFSNDGNYLAYGPRLSTGMAVRVIKIDDKSLVSSIPGRFDRIYDIAISPDNNFLAVTFHKIYKLKIFDFNSGLERFVSENLTSFLNINYTSDNKYFITNIGNILRKYNNPLYTEVGDKQEINNDIIFPNPASDFIEINIGETGRSLGEIGIYDVFGRKVTTPALRATPPYEESTYCYR